MKQTIRKGVKGNPVIELQKILNQILVPSPNLKPDGDFGEMTEKAVLQFQKDVRLPADGIVGNKTWKAMAEASAHKTTTQLPQFLLADIAGQYIGVRETGNNKAGTSKEMLEIFNADNLIIKGNTDGYPWCASFVSLCVQKLCRQSVFYCALIPPREASVSNFLNVWAKQNRCMIFKPTDKITKAVKGDIVVFTFSHIGIIESNNGSLLKTIEGNTNETGSREGVKVMRKNRFYGNVQAFIRLPMSTMGLDEYLVNFAKYC